MDYELQNKPKNSKTAIAVMVFMFFLGFVLWAVFSPIESGSIMFWFGLALMGLPVIAFVESIGELILNAKFISKFPRVVRITYAVIMMSLFVVASLFIVAAFPDMVV